MDAAPAFDVRGATCSSPADDRLTDALAGYTANAAAGILPMCPRSSVCRSPSSASTQRTRACRRICRAPDEPDLLQYLWDNGALDELVQSFVDNRFFEHEPLIAVREGDGWTALEGNRRLAALKVLLREPVAQVAEVTARLDEPPDSATLDALREVPVYVVADREEVHKYLGFRHIGGIKTWSAEAKARYLRQETERAAARGLDQPFLEVARRVGSNSQGIRERLHRNRRAEPRTIGVQDRDWPRSSSAASASGPGA